MNKLKRNNLDNIPSSWIIWIIFYSYCICSAILFQQIALPFLAPALHAGNGLLLHDSLFFHEKAIVIAEALGQEGWASWRTVLERSPSGNVTVVALVYALFGFNPTLLIPINAALHASAGLLLIKIGQALFPQNNYKWWCFFAGFLFIIFPSSLNWYGQIHKDGYAILGFYLILYSGVLLLNKNNNKLFFIFSSLIFGILLTIFVRPHNLLLYTVLSLVMGVIALINFNKLPKLSFIQIIFAIIIISSTILFKPKVDQSVSPPQGAIQPHEINTITTPELKVWAWEQANKTLPKSIDDLAKKISNLRAFMATSAIAAKSGSVIDAEVMPNNIIDFILYLPRAVTVGIFAPFPQSWFNKINALKLVAIAETLIWYIFVPGFLFAVWKKRKSILLWWLLIPSFFILMIESYITANLGTLFRIRYPFLFIFIMIGVLGTAQLISIFLFDKNRNKNKIDIKNSQLINPHGNPSTQSSLLVMSTKKTLLTICLTSGLLIGFFIRDILLARKLGVGEEFDSFQFASFLPLLLASTLAVPLGPTLLNFFIVLKEGSSQKIVSSWVSAVSACLLTFFTFLGILSYILSIMLSNYFDHKINIINLAPWFAAVVVFSTSVVISNAVLYANNRSVKANSAALVVPIVSILLIYLFGSKFGAIVAAIGLLIGQLINLWIVAKECNLLGYSIYPKFGEIYWRKWFPQYLPFIASTSMISLTIPIGIFFASQLPSGSIGVFSLGAKISQSFNLMISLTLISIALPYFSKKFSQDKIIEASHSLELVLLITTVLAIPLSISIFLLSNTISYLIFFDQYISLSDLNNISSVIRLCSIQLPFFIVFATLIKFRVASKQLISVATATAIGQTFNILLSFLLVDRYGVNGLAIAMSISMFLAAIVLLIWSALDSYISLVGFAQVVISWLLLITLGICLYWKNWPGFFICVGTYVLIVVYEIFPLIRFRLFNFKY